MSRIARTVLSAVVLTALLAAPVHAAPDSRPVAETLWRWVVAIWQDTHLTIDPNGIRWTIDPDGSSQMQGETRLTIDPDGSSTNTEGSGEGDISWTIDPNG